MCLALIAIDQHPLFPLIILSNRDEFYKRTSSPADYWSENQNIYSGRDLQEGGTWLGVNRTGHFSLVTNYRNPGQHKASMKSRGHLVANFLLASEHCSPDEYLNKIKSESRLYNNFNLLVGSRHQVYYYSSVENEIKKLSKGVYGLSNHLLDSPWYKLNKTKELFYALKEEVIQSSTPEQVIELLFPILSESNLSPEHLLPQTGVEHSLEQRLSPVFVDIPEYGYGTNQSTIVIFEPVKIIFAEKKFQYDTMLKLVSKTGRVVPLVI
jgi:uncharacterized protein with NRDE domain